MILFRTATSVVTNKRPLTSRGYTRWVYSTVTPTLRSRSILTKTKVSSSSSNNGNSGSVHVRVFSSSDSSVTKAAESLSVLSESVAEGGTEKAQELAQQLSAEARKELAALSSKQAAIASSSSSKAAGATTVPEPSFSDLRLVALQQAIPFVGFGIMDNAILIMAGDAIDTSLGVLLGISTMCAAAIGNIVSDLAGILLGTVIEDFCTKLGLPVPQLSTAQRQLRSVRYSGQFGCAVGIVIGCIIGMFPLLFIDSNRAQKLKQEARMDTLFHGVINEAKSLIGAELVNLFVVVDSMESSTPTSMNIHGGDETEDGKPKEYFFYCKYRDAEKGFTEPVHTPMGVGLVSKAAQSGQPVVIHE